MKKIILTLISCMAFAFAYTQDCGSGGTTTGSSTSTGSFTSAGSVSSFNGFSNNLHAMAGLTYSHRYLSAVDEYDKIDGSPFLFEESSSATLVMNDGTEIENVPIKYDLYANEIIATNDKGEDIILDTRYYEEIFIEKEGETLSFKKANPKQPKKFYEVLYESGDVVFFKDQEARLRKGENLGVAKTNSKFNQHKKYFVKGQDGALARVNLKKRDVFNHFPEIEAIAFQEYIKTTKIKLSKEKDYKALFASMDDD